MGQGARPPVTRKLPYLKSYRDRHGVVRHYLRMQGRPTVALPGEYGTREFADAYWAARERADPREKGADKIAPGSIGALVVLYYQSKPFKGLQPKTRATYRGVLEKLREQHGDKLVKGIKQRHVIAILDGLEANEPTWRKCVRLVLNLAVERGWIDVHPMAGLRRPRKAKMGFRAWTPADVMQFQARWPSGSRERLALMLLLYTGQRRSDVIGMGRQHVKDGSISVVQQKTGTRLEIPLSIALKAELALAPPGQLTFLQTQYGQPFTANGFGNWFRDAAKAAGLPERSNAHGLRKAAAAALAEAGCTDKEIMAITGHKNLSEVTLYTASADQTRLAKQAMARLEKRTKGLTAGQPGRQTP